MTSTPYGPALLAGIFAWAIYRRFRRNIGRQKLQPGRLIVRLVILGLVSVLMLAAGFVQPLLAITFAGGALLGGAASFLGLRHTRFETTADGHYYTPNTYIGVGLSLLLVARMAYRLFLLRDPNQLAAHPAAFQSPLTFFILGLTLGYYLGYCTGLFFHTRDPR